MQSTFTLNRYYSPALTNSVSLSSPGDSRFIFTDHAMTMIRELFAPQAADIPAPTVSLAPIFEESSVVRMYHFIVDEWQSIPVKGQSIEFINSEAPNNHGLVYLMFKRSDIQSLIEQRYTSWTRERI